MFEYPAKFKFLIFILLNDVDPRFVFLILIYVSLGSFGSQEMLVQLAYLLEIILKSNSKGVQGCV